jgi:hypothetical protein
VHAARRDHPPVTEQARLGGDDHVRQPGGRHCDDVDAERLVLTGVSADGPATV